ncbi:MAG: 2-amino-4-hydroxy-6-hydroxymethyldihydropteridine diphosphokinase [Pseudomonadota bacterium]
MSASVREDARWSCAYVGVGSNLDDPPRQVAEAIECLNRSNDSRVARVSDLWRTLPVGPQDQPDYCNAVVGLLVKLKPKDLLRKLLGIELDRGRRRNGVRWGARVIDLDLLHVVGHECSDDALTLPHPRACDRAFVMVPWAEVAPDVMLPDGRSVSSHARALDATGMRKWAAQAAST